ncbi:IS200/IS605 family accessory protein TnpB-related protein [Streptomyces sp. NPDC014861]|uniref:IS200/IS605 family accessory protein TnpB-related protein n=1 Tax=Streptomyces sp. NPDC014861 TaxID=3364923 RepID=UPI0036FA06DB
MGDLRKVSPSFTLPRPSGVAVRTGLKQLTERDCAVLGLVGAHLGSLASRDLRRRCAEGLEHSAASWAERKRALTGASSSRWAGAVTKATHEQWALSRRCQWARIENLEAGVRTLAYRLSLPLGAKGTKRAPGGYLSRQEWHAKARRLRVLEDRLAREWADHRAGRTRVVRGGRKLAGNRHHLAAAGLTAEQWRQRWEAERAFLQADGESGKRFGNETIRVTPDGEVSIKLPAPLSGLANAPRGRYVLASRAAFRHRGDEWSDRVSGNRAVAYRIHHDTARGRWYLTASWQVPPTRVVPVETAVARGVIGVDMNADHLAAWRLDRHGNPTGEPRTFAYDLSGSAGHRDAQIRHALTRLLRWARRHGLTIAVENLGFQAEKTREKHGRRRSFRKLISGLPVARLRARLVAMAGELGMAIVAVDPAYTSKWGAQHWQEPLTTTTRRTTRHQAASVAIGRRALGHPIRRRTAPPPAHQSDEQRHRTVQARAGTPGREETRPRVPGPRTRCVPPDTERKRATRAPTTVRGVRGEREWVQEPLLNTG